MGSMLLGIVIGILLMQVFTMIIYIMQGDKGDIEIHLCAWFVFWFLKLLLIICRKTYLFLYSLFYSMVCIIDTKPEWEMGVKRGQTMTTEEIKEVYDREYSIIEFRKIRRGDKKKLIITKKNDICFESDDRYYLIPAKMLYYRIGSQLTDINNLSMSRLDQIFKTFIKES